MKCCYTYEDRKCLLQKDDEELFHLEKEEETFYFCRFHAPLEASNKEGQKKKDLSLNLAQDIQQRINARDYLEKEIDFSHMIINEPLKLELPTDNAPDLVFNYSTFHHEIVLKGHCAGSFESCTFHKDVTLSHCTTYMLNFANSVFHGSAYFDNLRESWNVNFRGAKFKGEKCIFTDAILTSKNLRFRGLTADFAKCSFNNQGFSGIDFSNIYAAYINFQEAYFSSSPKFIGLTVGESAYFQAAHFPGGADFRGIQVEDTRRGS